MAAVTKGIVGRKIGMTRVFDESARSIPVTVIEAGPCRVSQIRTPQIDGYSAIQLAFSDGKVNSPEAGHLSKAGLGGYDHLVEIRVPDASQFTLGQELTADVFAAGEPIDVIGTSKGKGFAGVYKRYNFGGAPYTHGTQRKHRTPGSVGAGTTPGRIFKGQRMPGRMGSDRVTILNLEVVKSDPEKNLLLVKGAVPGPNGGIVIVRSAVKGGK